MLQWKAPIYYNNLYLSKTQNNHNLILLHFVYEGNKTGEGGERTVVISILGELIPSWKKIDIY